jgi:hypothetical protein
MAGSCPGADAKPEQVAEWRRMLGVPDKADDYKFDIPEGLKVDDAALAEVRGELHKAGLDPEQYASVMGLWANRTKAEMDAKAQASVQEANATKAELAREWGAGEFDGRLARAERVLEWTGLGETLAKAGLTGNAAVIRALDKMALAMGEDTIAGTERGMSRGTAEQRLDEVQKRMMQLPSTSPEYKRLSAERKSILGGMVAVQEP